LSDTQNYKAASDYLKFSGIFPFPQIQIVNLKAHREKCLEGFHFDNISGGVYARSPRYFPSAYVWCDRIRGDIAHSCIHGKGPHRIKVVVGQKDNDKKDYKKLMEKVPMK
jgi:hypothetical protein